MFKRSLTLFVVMLIGCCVFAQEQAAGTEMADVMRGNGKIYVVVAVMLTIFAGIILYLVRLENKISKLEKNNSLN